MKLKIIIWGVLLFIVILLFLFMFLFNNNFKTKDTNSNTVTNQSIENIDVDIEKFLLDIILKFYNDDLSPQDKISSFKKVSTNKGLDILKGYLGFSDEAHNHEHKPPSSEIEYSIKINNLDTYTKTKNITIYTVSFFDLDVFINKSKNTSKYLWKCQLKKVDDKLFLDSVSIS